MQLSPRPSWFAGGSHTGAGRLVSGAGGRAQGSGAAAWTQGVRGDQSWEEAGSEAKGKGELNSLRVASAAEMSFWRCWDAESPSQLSVRGWRGPGRPRGSPHSHADCQPSWRAQAPGKEPRVSEKSSWGKSNPHISDIQPTHKALHMSIHVKTSQEKTGQ